MFCSGQAGHGPTPPPLATISALPHFLPSHGPFLRVLNPRLHPPWPVTPGQSPGAACSHCHHYLLSWGRALCLPEPHKGPFHQRALWGDWEWLGALLPVGIKTLILLCCAHSPWAGVGPRTRRFSLFLVHCLGELVAKPVVSGIFRGQDWVAMTGLQHLVSQGSPWPKSLAQRCVPSQL